jgi:Zn-dependent peptidase ImmA (M78 family)
MTNRDWAIENDSNPIEERQANAFAAELLMPLEWIEKDYRSHNGDYEELAHHYGVSKQCGSD